jgi:Alpha/beta hydrolase domain
MSQHCLSFLARMTRDVAVGILALAALASAAVAVVPHPVVTGPIPSSVAPGNPSHDYPFFATNLDLASNGYIEQEFFVEGTANRYNTPTLTTTNGIDPTGTVIDSGHPYKTRIVVRRPISAARFNGTVLVEWLNVTNGYDVEADWFQSYEHFMRSGYAWVGVSAQQAGVNFMRSWSARYASLDVTQGGSITNDALSYDIYSQVAQAIRTPGAVDVLGGLPWQRIIATGHSQSGGRLTTYYNSIQKLAGVYDAFVMHGPITGSPTRTDLGLKVFKILSETDVPGQARQADTNEYRTWEIAGTSHVDFQRTLAGGPIEARDLPTPPVLNCSLPPWSRIPFHYALNAVYDHLVDWMTKGILPPTAPGLTILPGGPPFVIARDSFGNALGGIRLSQHAVPTATNQGVNPGPAFAGANCPTNRGFSVPFDSATLATLYPSHDAYFNMVVRVSKQNAINGYILLPDLVHDMVDALMAHVPN